MKKLIVFFIILFAVPCFASPFLVSDPAVGVVSYNITGDPFFVSPVVAQADGSLRVDLAGISEGNHSITITASNMWGSSTPTNFTFGKSIPASPAGVRLVGN